MTDLWEAVDRLASKIAEGALNAGSEQQIEALKVLTAYRAASSKGKPLADVSGEGKVINFADMKAAIEGAAKEQTDGVESG